MFNPFRALKGYLEIKRFNRILRRFKRADYQTGGLIPLIDITGYQPTESIKTQPPDVSSGVQPPKSGSNAQKTIFDHHFIFTGSPNCKASVYFPKPEGEKKKHEVYIPLETAKRLIEKKNINRLRKHIPLPAVNEDITMYIHNFIETPDDITFYCLYCPCCGLPISSVQDKKAKCIICGQRLDLKEVTKDA